jgi:hypothetical protein
MSQVESCQKREKGDVEERERVKNREKLAQTTLSVLSTPT